MANNGIYAPGVSVNVQAPAAVFAAEPTNLVGIVGTAAWGPVGQATPLASNTFGANQPRKHDLGTVASEAALNGATAIIGVRATDGTDTAASGSLGGSPVSALYTGSEGNLITITAAAGGRPSTVTLTASKPGAPTEVYPNLAANAVAAAVNAGSGVARGPSNLIRLAANSTVSAGSPVTLTGGSDGAGISTTNAITALNALSMSGVLVAAIADLDDPASWSTQTAWGEQNACLMVLVSPAGQTVASAVSTAHTGGVDSYEGVLLAGDWTTVEDTVYGQRKTSPQGFYLGLRAALKPNQSVLNKPLSGIVATERTSASTPYSTSEIDQLSSAGIEVISQGLQRGGNSFGCLTGLNCSSNPATATDAYSTMTNFLKATLKGGAGQYIGEPNTADTRQEAKGAVSHLLASLVPQGILSLTDAGALPFRVVCDATNNPQDRVGEGYLQLDATVQYEGIIRQFNINLTGGATVSITDQSVTSL